MIEDGELAVEAYLGSAWETGSGTAYLSVFGLLQTLITQQDAARHLCESFGLSVQLTEALEEIRRVRINSVGHPTRTRPGKNGLGIGSHTIVRSSLNKTGFTLISSYVGGADEWKDIDLIALIEIQEREVVNVLRALEKELKKQDRLHLAEFRREKLMELFPDGHKYLVRKVEEACRTPSPRSIGIAQAALSSLLRSVDEYGAALKRRGAWYSTEMFSRPIEEVRVVLQDLADHFGSGTAFVALDRAFVHAVAIEPLLRELVSVAADIDQDYSAAWVTAVKPLEGSVLLVSFEDGVQGEIDVADIVSFVGLFEELQDRAFFEKVSVNEELGCVCWPNGADLDSDVLYSASTGASLPGQTSAVSA